MAISPHFQLGLIQSPGTIDDSLPVTNIIYSVDIERHDCRMPVVARNPAIENMRVIETLVAHRRQTVFEVPLVCQQQPAPCVNGEAVSLACPRHRYINHAILVGR